MSYYRTVAENPFQRVSIDTMSLPERAWAC